MREIPQQIEIKIGTARQLTCLALLSFALARTGRVNNAVNAVGEITPVISTVPARESTPQPEITPTPRAYLHDVPVYGQGNLANKKGCTLVCASMVVDYWQRQDARRQTILSEELFSSLRKRKYDYSTGIKLGAIEGELDTLGYEAAHLNEVSDEQLIELLQDGPVIATVKFDDKRNLIAPDGKYDHLVVLTGIDQDRESYTINNPWGHRGTGFYMGINDFNAGWEASKTDEGEARNIAVLRPKDTDFYSEVIPPHHWQYFLRQQQAGIKID